MMWTMTAICLAVGFVAICGIFIWAFKDEIDLTDEEEA